jgi:hypothetical protein
MMRRVTRRAAVFLNNGGGRSRCRSSRAMLLEREISDDKYDQHDNAPPERFDTA